MRLVIFLWLCYQKIMQEKNSISLCLSPVFFQIKNGNNLIKKSFIEDENPRGQRSTMDPVRRQFQCYSIFLCKWLHFFITQSSRKNEWGLYKSFDYFQPADSWKGFNFLSYFKLPQCACVALPLYYGHAIIWYIMCSLLWLYTHWNFCWMISLRFYCFFVMQDCSRTREKNVSIFFIKFFYPVALSRCHSCWAEERNGKFWEETGMKMEAFNGHIITFLISLITSTPPTIISEEARPGFLTASGDCLTFMLMVCAYLLLSCLTGSVERKQGGENIQKFDSGTMEIYWNFEREYEAYLKVVLRHHQNNCLRYIVDH